MFTKIRKVWVVKKSFCIFFVGNNELQYWCCKNYTIPYKKIKVDLDMNFMYQSIKKITIQTNNFYKNFIFLTIFD